MDADIWRIARRRCLTACGLALIIVGAALYDVLPRAPLLYLALGLLLGSALRNAAVLMNTLIYSWRAAVWRRGSAAVR